MITNHLDYIGSHEKDFVREAKPCGVNVILVLNCTNPEQGFIDSTRRTNHLDTWLTSLWMRQYRAGSFVTLEIKSFLLPHITSLYSQCGLGEMS